MKHVRTLILAILLVMTVVLAMGTTEAATPGSSVIPCGWFNCNGGPDFCITAAAMIGNVIIIVTCYTKAVY